MANTLYFLNYSIICSNIISISSTIKSSLISFPLDQCRISLSLRKQVKALGQILNALYNDQPMSYEVADEVRMSRLCVKGGAPTSPTTQIMQRIWSLSINNHRSILGGEQKVVGFLKASHLKWSYFAFKSHVLTACGMGGSHYYFLKLIFFFIPNYFY